MDPFELPRRGPGPTFVAERQTVCPECLQDVHEGEQARMYEGAAHHARCAREATTAERIAAHREQTDIIDSQDTY
jgi:hypothetical protein